MEVSRRILLVDDDRALLDGLRRKHRKAFELSTACGGEEGLERIEREGPFAVVVSDYTMPGMNGIAFLARVRERAPDSVRVMLTGNADTQSAIAAVNEGRIFRFLTKPCEDRDLTDCLEEALEQYRLLFAERVLLEQTVRGAIEVLSDILALTSPAAFGRSTRVRSYVRQMAAQLRIADAWALESAALLSQIGLVAVPADVVERAGAGQPLEERHAAVLARHPAIGGELLGKIPRLERVAGMIAHQRLRHADAATAELEPAVALGGQLLAAALDFDELVAAGAGRKQALERLRRDAGRYHPRLLKLLEGVELPGQHAEACSLPVRELRVGMLLDQDVLSTGGVMVVSRGHRVTPGLLARLRNYAELGSVTEPIRVLVVVADRADSDRSAA